MGAVSWPCVPRIFSQLINTARCYIPQSTWLPAQFSLPCVISALNRTVGETIIVSNDCFNRLDAQEQMVGFKWGRSKEPACPCIGTRPQQNHPDPLMKIIKFSAFNVVPSIDPLPSKQPGQQATLLYTYPVTVWFANRKYTTMLQLQNQVGRKGTATCSSSMMQIMWFNVYM